MTLHLCLIIEEFNQTCVTMTFRGTVLWLHQNWTRTLQPEKKKKCNTDIYGPTIQSLYDKVRVRQIQQPITMVNKITPNYGIMIMFICISKKSNATGKWKLLHLKVDK